MALKSNLHVLFVDDDELLVDMTSEMLTRGGCIVTGETSGMDALRQFSEHPDDFDIAIIDPRMPVISGLELAQRFRRIQPGFPVILYGGDISLSLLHDAVEDGISCCDKPATGKEMERAIVKALKR